MQAIDAFYYQHNAIFVGGGVKNICYLVATIICANTIEYPERGSYEYQTKSLGVTMLTKAFHEDNWIITPEAHYGNLENKIPDLLIECVRF